MASVVLLISQANAQHQELNEDPKLWGKSKKELDSANLLYHFQMGKLHGHLRTFYSSTFNKNSNGKKPSLYECSKTTKNKTISCHDKTGVLGAVSK